MAWIWEVWETVTAALGVRRYLISRWVSAGVTIVAGILLFYWGERLALIGTILIGLVLFLGIVAVAMTDYAMKLRRQLRPDLALTCDDPGCVVESPMQILRDSQVVDAARAVHIRVKVTTPGPTTVHQCMAGLTSVRKQRQDGSYEDSIVYETLNLPWSNKGHRPVDIGVHDQEYIDVLVVRMDQNHLTPCGETIPFRLGDLFTNPGLYEVKVAVTHRSVI